MSKILNTKNLIIAVVAFLFVLVAVVIYRMFLQFNSKDIAIYIDEEASKYNEDRQTAFKLIQDGVEHILSSHNLTQQVLKSSRASKTPKEQELVHAAIMQCKSLGYLD